MSEATRMLREWEAAIGMTLPLSPALPVDEMFRLMRRRILREEWHEYIDAEERDDLVAVADALGDMAYIIWGTALLYGIDLDAVLAEIHRSNMTKVGPNGEVIRRADGKILKPDAYEPPNLRKVLGLA